MHIERAIQEVSVHIILTLPLLVKKKVVELSSSSEGAL